MNGPGDIPLTQTSGTPDTRPCSFISIIPTLGMSSCRGRAEAFARRLSSKLRTLGSQTDNETILQEDESIVNGSSTNSWISNDSEHMVTDLQPLRHESDSFFDFDCELESPGSPVDECEYLRLIETASNTPHNSAAESGYACASAASSHSSTDGPYFDAPSLLASCSSVKHPSAVISSDSGVVACTSKPEDYSKEKCSTTCKSCNCNGFDKKAEENGEKLNQAVSLETANQIEPDDYVSCEKYTESMIEVQNKIINELQKEVRDSVIDNEDSIQNFAPTISSDAHDGTSATKSIVCSNDLTVKTNGYWECGNNALKIEVTEAKEEERDTVHADSNIEEEQTTKTNENKSTSKSVAAIDTTDDEDECRPQRVRRCSSLKTGKTPPGTPGRKKIVRFADVLGLDLADIKTFLDEIPTIPKSAFEDLEIMDAEPPLQLGPKSDKLLMPLFQQPGGLTTFLDLVRQKQVSLENAAVTDHINQTITGSVRVRNLDFHKSVHIRYTLDNWRSFADLQANYVENSCDGFSDKFTFILFGNSLQIGQRLEFAVRFQCKGQQFWDNNYGTNYCFQCLPTSSPTLSQPMQPIVPSNHNNNAIGMLSPTAGDAWCSSFY